MPAPRIIASPLSGPFTEGNTTVDVQIYRHEDSVWNLEVIDGEGSPTVWDDDFVSGAVIGFAVLSEALHETTQ